MGGRQGARPDARAALRLRRLRGRSAPTRPSAAPRSSATSDHLERLTARRSSTTWTCRTRSSKLREATHELIRPNKLRSCYIRPIAFRGYGEMGLFPLNAPVDVVIAVWPWGAYLGEEGQRHGIRCKVSSWRRMSPDSFIPQAKACGPVPELDPRQGRERQGGLRRGDPARRARATSREGSGENIFLVRDGEISTPPRDRVDPRRDHAPLGEPDRRRPRLRGRRARHRARRAVPGRRGLPDRHGGRDRARARDRRPPAGRARRAHAGDPEALLRGDQGQAARSTSSGSTSSTSRSPPMRPRSRSAPHESTAPDSGANYARGALALRAPPSHVRPATGKDNALEQADPAIRHDPSRRHAGRGHVPLRRTRSCASRTRSTPSASTSSRPASRAPTRRRRRSSSCSSGSASRPPRSAPSA